MSTLNPAQLIRKKRDGLVLSEEEIRAFVQGVTSGEVAPYQASAFLMAVYLNGMTLDETVSLTTAMADSGDRYDWSAINGPKVDKHSTGGVGDKISLILTPLAASCGLVVPMMAGRGLGHTGGTVDKLEAIPGYRAELTPEEFRAGLEANGCVITGQSERIAPADRILYGLRDVTATVESIPLITASILSKKIAEGTESLVLDLKVGSGAFMKTRPQARKLALSILKVSKKLGLRCRVVLTSMEEPLGQAVGNSLEVQECLDILQGKQSSAQDVKELTLQLCAHMLELGGKAKSFTNGRKQALLALEEGKAWTVFQNMIRTQGGSLPASFPKAPHVIPVVSTKSGYLTEFDSQALGEIVLELGGGRRRAGEKIDFAVGLFLHAKLGDHVKKGELLCEVHSNEPEHKIQAQLAKTRSAIVVQSARKSVPKLILEVL